MTATIPVDTSADAPVLHRREERGVHWITLNQPKAFNVLSEELLADLQRQLDAIAADAGARGSTITRRCLRSAARSCCRS